MNSELICLPGQGPIIENATSGNVSPAAWFLDWATGWVESDAGVSVNGYTALSHCPLWQGVNVIAGDIGQIPIRLVKDTFEEQRTLPAWNLTRLRPNQLQTASIWKETMMHWVLIWGNAVSWIIRQGTRPTELIPLRPDLVTPELVGTEGGQELFYHYRSNTTDLELLIPSRDVLHIQGLTSDGYWGYPLFEIARNCIGMGLSLERHGNRQFRNGVRPSGLLKSEKTLKDEARRKLREEFTEVYGGTENAGKVIVLQEGMDFMQTAITNIDAQWIEARKLDRQMAASLLNLPGWKLNATEDSAVRANLEETNADYTQRTLSRWFNRLSEEMGRKLLTNRQWLTDQYRFVWDVDEVLKADIDTMSQVVDKLVHAAIMNPNEAREKLGMAPYPGGDEYGSPAINPRDESESEESPPDESPDPEDPRVSAHRKLLLERANRFLKNEAMMLGRAAEGAKNFLEWVDEFYSGEKPKIDGHFEECMGPALEASETIGIQSAGARLNLRSYRQQRRDQILSLTDHVTQGALPAAISALSPNDTTAAALGLLVNVV